MQKRAFSLIELLIVVIIIGVVYTLAVTKLQKVGDSSKSVTLKTLKSYLHSLEAKKEATLLCLDDCLSCSIYVDGKKVEELEGKFENFIDDSIEVYSYDFLTGMQEIQQKVFFNSEDVEERVCFSYSVDKKGVGEQVFVKFKEKVYDYTPYLSQTKVYDTLEDVIELKENSYQEVLK